MIIGQYFLDIIKDIGIDFFFIEKGANNTHFSCSYFSSQIGVT